MIQKVVIGIIAGTLIGMFITSFFLPAGTPVLEIFYTKITATSMATGFFCAIYAYFSKSKLHFKAKHHKRDDSVISENTNMMNENSTNDMLTRALNLTSKKGFLSSSERLRLRFRSTTLNNIACFQGATSFCFIFLLVLQFSDDQTFFQCAEIGIDPCQFRN